MHPEHVRAKEYLNCNDIGTIDELADSNFLSYKSRIGTIVNSRDLSTLQFIFYYFLKLPDSLDDDDNPRELFIPVINDENLDSDFLSCGFDAEEVFECENSRLWNSGECTRETNIDGNVQEIIDCKKFDNQRLLEENSTPSEDGSETNKIACYPPNHICNKYLENVFNNYYNVNGIHFSSDETLPGTFFIYKKNVIPEGEFKNCELTKFTCDIKLKNESPGHGKNIVFKNLLNQERHSANEKFIENIFAGLGIKAFFKFVGSCKTGDADCNQILNSYFYYKYIDGTQLDSQTTVYYFEKNIYYQNIGQLCDGYLPTCREINVGESFSSALYNNGKNSNNNFGARKNFYETQLGNGKINSLYEIQEENVWFANNDNFKNYNCLAIHSDSANENDSDIGYCSDLSEEKNNLKYENGLTTKGKSIASGGTLLKMPNCYLKSCIDLTTEELTVIAEKGKIDGKYCSEYYWLSNTEGFKYFPRENPIYCSNLENKIPEGKQLVFRQGIFEYVGCKRGDNGYPLMDEDGICKSNEAATYYSYGGGLNKKRDNCYLKNCFSLTSAERKVISEAKLTNIGFELERSYGIDVENGVESEYDKSNIPLYCDSGFVFSEDIADFKGFDHLNLNVIPCFEMSPEQLRAMGSRGASSMILFTNLLKSYDTNNVYGFCRTHYIPLDTLNQQHDEYSLFLENVFVLANEIDRAPGNDAYMSFFNSGVFGTLNMYNTKKMSDFNLQSIVRSDYRKVPFSHNDIKKFKNIAQYGNICGYLDNNFPYYNADIITYDSTLIKNNPKLSSVVSIIKDKNENYTKCLSEANGQTSKSFNLGDSTIPEDCKSCYNADSSEQDKCLYGKDNCKIYAYNYGCKVANCSGNNLKYCEEEDRVMERIAECSKYKALSNGYSSSFFDCGLYDRENENKKKIFKDFETDLGKENINKINNACNSLLPLTDSRPEVKPDTLSKIIKPYKKTTGTTGILGTILLTILPGKDSLERYGCTEFKRPTFNYGQYGCKIPNDDSSYISISSNPEKAINGMDINSFSAPRDAKLKINVCSRYTSDVYSNNTCGEREKSDYSDKCVYIGDSGQETLEEAKNGVWYFTESTGGTRFRTEQKTSRETLVFRDFHTYHYCYSDMNREFQDGSSVGVIYGDGVLSGAIISLVACPIAFFFICAPLVTTVITPGIFLAVRASDWQINLQNDLQIARDYNKITGYEEKGFISKAFVTDNNDYMYRFYPRAKNIEDDLRNKLETNVDSEGSRFYHGNTRGRDIIEKCNLGNLFQDLNNCRGSNECNYKYQYNKLAEDGSSLGVCEEENLMNCIQDSQKICLESYGASFVSNSGIDNDFLTKTGAFLKYFENGAIIKDEWGTSSTKGHTDYVPVDIVYFTKDKQTLAQLKNNENCKFSKYGDPIGDLSRCRGFEHENLFYTESQTVKMPLLTSPFFFYTLVTPKNMPELFNPTLIVVGYYLFSNADIEVTYSTPDNVILDFFNPKIRYDYSFIGGVNDPDFDNILAEYNNFISAVPIYDEYSSPYILKYKSNNISELEYSYVLHKTYSKDIHNEYIPKVCLYKISVVPEKGNNNVSLNLTPCLGTGCFRAISGDENFILVDNDVECHPRIPPNFSDFIFKPDKNMAYNRAFINVYLGPKNISSENIMDEKNAKYYSLREGDKSYVENFGENKILGYGLNFSHSYCSKAYHDYYLYLDQIAKEKASPNGDTAKINRLLKNIGTIENIIMPDCDEEEGIVSEVLINADKMKTLKNVGVSTKVVVKEIARVKKYNENYGGHSEICVSDYDIEKIFKLREKFGADEREMPTVLVFKASPGRKSKTKCVLSSLSMNQKDCLEAEQVYVFCSDYDIKQTSNCEYVLNVNSFEMVYVKKINCLNYLGATINENNIEAIKACFKGGFNYRGTIYNADGGKKEKCTCKILGSREMFETELYDSRPMTPREYGLCIDLKKPIICPAVKYYDSSKQYTNNELALNRTEEELEEGLKTDYEQHIWRADEKQVGILPAVFYNITLGHAEFPSSVYCEADIGREDGESYYNENCIGGSKFVMGECVGFWKQNDNNVPKAICTAKKSNTGTILYEYELVREADDENSSDRNKYECVRYYCPNVGYDDLGYEILDERDIDIKFASQFSKVEINDYVNVALTDYRSFVNNEEKSPKTIDTRGSFNGFAIWKKIVSLDYAQLVQSKQCLTGFAPAGSSYIIKISSYNDDNNDYDAIILPYSSIVALYKNQVTTANSYYSRQNFPKRICNQMGEWLKVDDMYNNATIDKNNKAQNFYHNATGNFWLSVLANDVNQGLTDNIGLYGNNYCERLVCGTIITKNENIYLNEVLNGARQANYGQISKYTTWRHSGGANWDNISSSRNSTSKIEMEGAFSDSSRNIMNIFNNNNISDTIIDNKYKYVKKVRGTCSNIFGYYNRDSEFSGLGEFAGQLSSLRPRGFAEVDPRETTLLLDGKKTSEPTRVCTSVSLWGGITNRCFRACEMLNIYNAKLHPSLYENKKNLKPSENYYVENHHILNVDTRGEEALSESYRESRLSLYSLRESDSYRNFMLGDYLTGGATWPRSIVNTKSAIETKTSSEKKGLRYVEVTGNCDSTYNRTSDNKPSQYVVRSLESRPKRKCYEDGTWGQVEGDTRCLLAKNCVPFDFRVEDMANLIKLGEGGRQNFDAINTFITNIYYNQRSSTATCTANENGRNEYGCAILRFDAGNTTIDTVIKSTENSSDSGAFSENDLGIVNSSYNKPKLNQQSICCLSEVCRSADNSKNYVAGWSLNTYDIGDYFVPKSCKVLDYINAEYTTNNFYIYTSGVEDIGIKNTKYLNRLKFVSDENKAIKPHYAKSSFLHLVYNRLHSDLMGNYVEKLLLDGETIDDSEKSIQIGTQQYESYQVRATCDERLFYNENTGDQYFSKDIVFECRILNNDEVQFAYSDKTKSTNGSLGDKLIRAEDCKPKMCGVGPVYQSQWSHSYVKDVAVSEDKYGLEKNIFSAYKSSLTCETNNKAFIVDAGESNLNEENVEFYTNSGTSYKQYGFIKKLTAECLTSTHENNKINGKTKLKDYDLHVYGELDNAPLPHRFCSDIGKTECATVSENELINNEKDFLEKYCVKMSCPGKGLRYDSEDRKILYKQDSNFFNLPNEDYNFGDVIVIQSYLGDFDDNKIVSKGAIKKNMIKGEYLQNPNNAFNGITGSVCPETSDIYNDTIPNYSISTFIANNGDDPDIVQGCFNLLEGGANSLKKSSSCEEGYKSLGDNMCAQYRIKKTAEGEEEIEIVSTYDSISEFKATIRVYLTGNAGYSEETKQAAVESLMTMYPPNSQITNELNIIDKEAKQYAHEDTVTKFKDLKESLICKYDDEITAYSETDEKYAGVEWYQFDGKIYGLVENALETEGCTKDVQDGETPRTISGKFFQARNVFDGYYIESYNNKYRDLLSAFKNKIKSGQAASEINDLYMKWCKMYKMKNFLLKNCVDVQETNGESEIIMVKKCTNLDNFNLYLKEIAGIEYEVLYTEGASPMFNFQVTETEIMEENDSETITKTKSYGLNLNKNSSNQFFCTIGIGSSGGETISEETACTDNLDMYAWDANNAYSKYFLDFLGSSETTGSSEENDSLFSPRYQITKYIEREDSLKKNCESIYKKFLTAKEIFEGNTGNASFRSGFFMAMKCTPNGWEILDSPSCKKRCSTNSGDFIVNSSGVGRWAVKITANNIRHSRSYKHTISATASSACCGGDSRSQRAEVWYSCEDGVAATSKKTETDYGLEWSLDHKANGCYWAAFAAWWAVIACLCAQQECSVVSRIQSLDGVGPDYSHRGKSDSKARLVIVCPGGNDDGFLYNERGDRDCKIDNCTDIRYSVINK
jgi:hypothetical protein